jgi:protein TonB
MRSDGSRFFAASVAAHMLLGGALASVQPKARHEAVAISFRDVSKPKPPSKIDPPPDREPPPAPTHATRAKAAPAKPTAAEPSRAVAPSSRNALPDFGLSLSGGGAGGMAVPAGGGGGATAPATTANAKTLSRATASKGDDCAEPPAKPRPLSRPSPVYTEQARSAGISGKVRVEITVDERGRVVNVRAIQGLGYGLDEAAIAAARAMTFEPAVRCGRASSASFKIGFTFAP